MIQLRSFLHPAACLELAATDKRGALQELATAATRAGLVGDADVFFARLLHREEQASTGLGLGIALPHASSDTVQRMFLAVGRAPAGIPYAAPDAAPVQLIFLIGVHQDRSAYLKLVARVTRLARDPAWRARLLGAPTAAEVFALLSAE